MPRIRQTRAMSDHDGARAATKSSPSQASVEGRSLTRRAPEPEPGLVPRSERWANAGQDGSTVWITGLPAAGKSTLAAHLELELVRRDLVVLRLDGDNLRHGLCRDLGFTAADRTENVRRVAHVARLAAERESWSLSHSSHRTGVIARRPGSCTRTGPSASSRSS
jgi:bifunctional enzyme CysN/CysC